MLRLLLVVLVALIVAGGAGLLLGGGEEPELRRAGLPPAGDTVATLLDDGSPVFVSRTGGDIRVVDAQTPPRRAPGGTVAVADLIDGLVAWCEGRGFVDDLPPPATFTLAGRPTGAAGTGLGIHPIVERGRGHVMVDDAVPAGAGGAASPGAASPGPPASEPSAMVGECDDPERTDDHGQALRGVELGDVPPGPYWVVEAAVDLRAGVLCPPPPDPLAWPLCPDGGVAAELPRREPAGDLAAEHGAAYAERGAYGFVGRFVVHREQAGQPLQRVWRAPYAVQARARPHQRRVEARLSPARREAATVTGEAPLATLAVDADDDVPATLPVEPVTEVVVDGEALTGQAAADALRRALDAEPDRRWALRIRHDPLRPPRLLRAERLAP